MHNRSMFKPLIPKAPKPPRRSRAGRRWLGRAFRVAFILAALAIWALLLFAPQLLFNLTLFWLAS